MDYKIFNSRMRQLVESSGKLYKDVASDLGIAAPTLTRYMTGERVPELTYLVRVCEHFHVSLDWLIGLSGDKYELLSPELQEVATLYATASLDDRRVIQAVLSKYKREVKNDDSSEGNPEGQGGSK